MSQNFGVKFFVNTVVPQYHEPRYDEFLDSMIFVNPCEYLIKFNDKNTLFS